MRTAGENWEDHGNKQVLCCMSSKLCWVNCGYEAHVMKIVAIRVKGWCCLMLIDDCRWQWLIFVNGSTESYDFLPEKSANEICLVGRRTTYSPKRQQAKPILPHALVNQLVNGNHGQQESNRKMKAFEANAQCSLTTGHPVPCGKQIDSCVHFCSFDGWVSA